MHAGSAKDKKAAKEDLIPSVWRHLPVELLEKVLTKLTPFALKTFRQVCKRWKVLTESEEFALQCDSVESTLFFVFHCSRDNRYIALPNLATDSWDKHDVEFLSEGEEAVFLAADQGLLLYQVWKPWDIWAQEIFLIVQNPLSQMEAFGRSFQDGEMDVLYAQCSLLGGLIVDPGTGNFKVVVAFIAHIYPNCSMTPRKAFIYDSSSNSWTVSVTEAPALVPQLPDSFLSYWRIGKSIYCGGELYWLVEEFYSPCESRFQVKTLIKYNMQLDAWDMVTVKWPCGEIGHLNFASFQDQLFMVNLYDSNEKILLPPEFSQLAPDMEMFDVGSVQCLLERVGDTIFDGEFKSLKAFAEGGNWFLLSDALPVCVDTGCVDILLVSNSRSVMPLPRLQCDIVDTRHSPLLSGSGVFGTFPASWRLSRKLDRQLVVGKVEEQTRKHATLDTSDLWEVEDRR